MDEWSDDILYDGTGTEVCPSPDGDSGNGVDDSADTDTSSGSGDTGEDTVPDDADSDESPTEDSGGDGTEMEEDTETEEDSESSGTKPETDKPEAEEDSAVNAGEDGKEDAAADLDGISDGEADGDDVRIDPAVVCEINDALHGHAALVEGFVSSLTVSENSLTVSLDTPSRSLLIQSVDRQDAVLDALEGMSGLLALVFFVLVFDLLHRSAKRIIKNFIGGDRNGTNS